MSATPGKVVVAGISEVNGEQLFVLKFLQGHNPEWTNRVFFARFDAQATWLDELQFAQGESECFSRRNSGGL